MKATLLDPAAAIELQDATRHYLEVSPELATDFVDRVERALHSIGSQPRRFSKLETVKTDREIRRVLLARFPYLIIYEVLNELPYVLAVAHAHRRPAYWLERQRT